MQRIVIGGLAALLLAAPETSSAQQVPEGVHRDSTGPSTICGLKGQDAPDLIGQLRQSRAFKEEPKQSPRFDIFSSQDGLTQFVATTKGEAAYPAVICRQFYKDAAGGTSQKRDMRCDASRAACDKLFLEFEELDAQMRRYVQGR